MNPVSGNVGYVRLEFRDVIKKFQDRQGSGQTITAVEGVTLSVRDGEVVSLIGPSGCGKSTLLNMASGLNGSSGGEVFVDGEEVVEVNEHVAFAPLFVLWFGFGLEPRILIAVLIVFFPVLINVMTAVRNIDPDLINLARSLKASRMQVFWKIQVPASMPPMFAGLRIGATLAVIGVAVGEFAGGNTGVGYLIVLTAGAAETAKVFAAIFVLTIIGIIAYWLVILLENRVLHYMPSREQRGF